MTLLPIGSGVKNAPLFRVISRNKHQAWTGNIATHNGKVVVIGQAWEAGPDGCQFGWGAELGIDGGRTWSLHRNYGSEMNPVILRVLARVLKWLRSRKVGS